jgi:hypothetical protein
MPANFFLCSHLTLHLDQSCKKTFFDNQTKQMKQVVNDAEIEDQFFDSLEEDNEVD